MKFVVLALGLACSTLFTMPSLAQNIDPVSPYYGGIALGLFIISDSTANTSASLISALGGTVSVSQETNGYTGRLFGGAHLDHVLSFELGYHQTASVAQTISGVASNNGAYTGSASLGINGWDYSILIRTHRANNHQGPFLRLGGHHLTVGGNVKITATSSLANTTTYEGSGFLWGAGYDLPIKDSLNIRAEYLGYKNIAGKDGNTDNYYVAVVKHF